MHECNTWMFMNDKSDSNDQKSAVFFVKFLKKLINYWKKKFLFIKKIDFWNLLIPFQRNSQTKIPKN